MRHGRSGRTLQIAENTRPRGSAQHAQPSQAKHVYTPRGVGSRKKEWDNAERRLLSDFLQLLGTPMAQKVWELYSTGQHDKLVQLEIDPRTYDDVGMFRRDWAAVKLLSKHSGLKTGIDTDKVALDSAYQAETQCSLTNKTFINHRNGSSYCHRRSELIQLVREKIRLILGAPRGFREVGWSKGRTTSAFGDSVTPLGKYASKPHVTVSASPYALRILRGSPLWGQSVLEADGPCSLISLSEHFVRGNTLLIVPKNAKTGRSICYEPHMNIRLQLTVGDLIRRRLARVGVDLSDQSINQRRAQHGSKFGHLSTIDLRSASDTLSLEVVRELLPSDWFQLLDDLRSRYTLWPDGSTRWNEKFSSMGNGFTFELESLIFYAICESVCADGVTVYGDDIVIPTEHYSATCEALKMFGFLVNEKKSFSSGHFRESCGGDFICGVSVTPVYLRHSIKNVQDVVLLHNQIRRWALQNHNCGSEEVNLLLRKWRDIFPCYRGPQGYGDGHYHVDLTEADASRAGRGLDGWWFNTFVPVLRVHKWGSDQPQGVIPDRFGAAALCAATGPKRPKSLWDQEFDRRRVSYRKHRGLANFVWPDGHWV